MKYKWMLTLNRKRYEWARLEVRPALMTAKLLRRPIFEFLSPTRRSTTVSRCASRSTRFAFCVSFVFFGSVFIVSFVVSSFMSNECRIVWKLFSFDLSGLAIRKKWSVPWRRSRRISGLGRHVSFETRLVGDASIGGCCASCSVVVPCIGPLFYFESGRERHSPHPPIHLSTSFSSRNELDSFEKKKSKKGRHYPFASSVHFFASHHMESTTTQTYTRRRTHTVFVLVS